MTISAARLNANRRNASQSKGPVTEAGRARVRLNAFKHGLRAESEHVGRDEAEALTERQEQWTSAFPVAEGDGRRAWITHQIALTSVRIDRCQEHQRAQVRADADRAACCWEVDRVAEAAALGARLAKDPDVVVSTLRRSAAGIDWLLDRWRALGDLLGCVGGWDDAQRRLCLDLMQAPDVFRDAERRRLEAMPLDELRELVGEHAGGLEGLRASAARLDESDRALAEVGLPTSEGPELRRLRRYEAGLWRRYRMLEASWKAGHAEAPAGDVAGLHDDPIVEPPAFARMAEAEAADGDVATAAPGADEGSGPRTIRPAPPCRPATARHRADRPAAVAPRGRDAEAQDPPSRTTPDAPAAERPTPSVPPVLMNRRARRALMKAMKRSR